jgi:hypothetical protein
MSNVIAGYPRPMSFNIWASRKRRVITGLALILFAGIAVAAIYHFDNCSCDINDPEDVNLAINSIFNGSPGAPSSYSRGDVIVVSATPGGDKATYTWATLSKSGWVPCVCKVGH